MTYEMNAHRASREEEMTTRVERTEGGRRLMPRIAAVIGAAALLLSGAPAAHAASVPDAATIIITKTSQPVDLGEAGTGLPVTSGLGDPIGGVTFAAHLVTAVNEAPLGDLSTNADQLLAASATVDNITVETTASVSAETASSDGTLSWNLPRGLYLVRETSTPAGVLPADAFLLSVPTANPDTATQGEQPWLDTIYVYPKNSRLTASKTADTSAFRAVGESVPWTILADAPRTVNNAGTDFRSVVRFDITDELPAGLNAPELDAAAHVVTIVDSANSAAAPVELVLDTHYTVTASGPEGKTITLVLTETGLAELDEANAPGALARVSWKFSTVVNSAALTTGLENTAVVSTSVDDEDGDPATPGTETEVGTEPGDGGTLLFGAQEFVKVAQGSREGLEGATFRVYADEADARAGNDAYLVVNGDDIWTSGADGTLIIDGLLRSDSVDGKLITDEDAFSGYYLVEVDAPAGYQRLAEPVPFQVLPDAAPIDVVNIETGLFMLPLTGGAGTVLFTVAGVLLLGGVVLIVLRRRAKLAASGDA